MKSRKLKSQRKELSRDPVVRTTTMLDFTTLFETGWIFAFKCSSYMPEFRVVKARDQGGNVRLLLAVLAVLHSYYSVPLYKPFG